MTPAERAARDDERRRWTEAMFAALKRMDGPAADVARAFLDGQYVGTICRRFHISKYQAYRLRKQAFAEMREAADAAVELATKHDTEPAEAPSTNGG